MLYMYIYEEIKEEFLCLNNYRRWIVVPWQWTSYPSGRSAIVYCSAGAELGRTGYYLIAYDDTNDHRMLACFTPAGRGVCYSTNGNIRYRKIFTARLIR